MPKTHSRCEELFAGFDPEEHKLLTMDGYDDCIVGIVERFGQDPIVCYDKEKVLSRLESGGVGRDEADKFFYFSQTGARMPRELAPCFLSINAQAQQWAKPIKREEV